MMEILSNFDSGNIVCKSNKDPSNIILEISPDKGGKFFQWFYYRLSGAKDIDVTMRIINAGEASYTQGWLGYQALTTFDRKEWTRVKTEYHDGILTINHKPNSDLQWYAYFAPYSLERLNDLIAKCQQSEFVEINSNCLSVEKRSIDIIKAGSSQNNDLVCWIIARQHPGESMASWLMEGLIKKLILEKNTLAKRLLDSATFYLVPNMNPDGSFHGFLRTNTKGVNLNREWETPSLSDSPEVYNVRELMKRTGCNFFLDIHGDEALPYNFIAGPDGVPSINQKQISLVRKFEKALCDLSIEFQDQYGYPKNQPGKANLKIAGNWVAEYFGCPAMTLEQPFKDNAKNPDSIYGWSLGKSSKLGITVLEALDKIIPDL
ncbi:MAG: hypothetical protein CL567_02055 [Alphaproteobacteria bacterium]|nr:hypothetical protein [Alphaproteobacteria bacterium]